MFEIWGGRGPLFVKEYDKHLLKITFILSHSVLRVGDTMLKFF